MCSDKRKRWQVGSMSDGSGLVRQVVCIQGVTSKIIWSLPLAMFSPLSSTSPSSSAEHQQPRVSSSYHNHRVFGILTMMIGHATGHTVVNSTPLDPLRNERTSVCSCRNIWQPCSLRPIRFQIKFGLLILSFNKNSKNKYYQKPNNSSLLWYIVQVSLSDRHASPIPRHRIYINTYKHWYIDTSTVFHNEGICNKLPRYYSLFTGLLGDITM